MRIGRNLTVTEVYNQILNYHTTIEQTVEETVQCMLNENSVVGILAALLGLNSTTVPISALSLTNQSIPKNDFTSLSWETVLIDGLGIFDAENPHILTLPADGIYHINFVVQWDTSVHGVRKSYLNGVIEPSGFIDKEIDSVDVCTVTIAGEFSVYHANTILAQVYQSTPNALGVYKAEIMFVRRCLMPHIVEY